MRVTLARPTSRPEQVMRSGEPVRCRQRKAATLKKAVKLNRGPKQPLPGMGRESATGNRPRSGLQGAPTPDHHPIHRAGGRKLERRWSVRNPGPVDKGPKLACAYCRARQHPKNSPQLSKGDGLGKGVYALMLRIRNSASLLLMGSKPPFRQPGFSILPFC